MEQNAPAYDILNDPVVTACHDVLETLLLTLFENHEKGAANCPYVVYVNHAKRRADGADVVLLLIGERQPDGDIGRTIPVAVILDPEEAMAAYVPSWSWCPDETPAAPA